MRHTLGLQGAGLSQKEGAVSWAQHPLKLGDPLGIFHWLETWEGPSLR